MNHIFLLNYPFCDKTGSATVVKMIQRDNSIMKITFSWSKN